MQTTEQARFKNSSTAQGSWKRNPTLFHGKISSEPGAEFPPEAGRYRLYVCYACPWANRTMIVRKLKGLEKVIALTATNHTIPHITPGEKSQSELYKGWEFVMEGDLNEKHDVSNPFFEPHGFTTLSQLYELAHPGYREEYLKMAARPVYSVPVLFDEKTQKIVSNESAEIIVMLNAEFNAFAQNPDLDLNPEELQSQMKALDEIIYPGINDGVYRCGFARSQEAYNDAYTAHWKAMDEVENLLGQKKFLTGDQITLSDVRLFVTLIRYDAVYYSHFKTSRTRIQEMPNMLRFLKSMYNYPGVKSTVHMDFIVKHYFGSQKTVNPTGIWPLGPLQKDYLKYLEE